MKKDLSKMLRSILSVCLALCMVISGLPLTALAADTDEPVDDIIASMVEDLDGDGEITYVSFGDSVTNGYGMDGYRYENGRNVLGFKREVEAAYPALVKGYLEEQGMVVDLEQMAISGFRMDELHWMLDEDGSYIADPYHSTRYSGWNADLLEDLLAEEDWVEEKYGPIYGTSEADLLANADAIISNEYREAVRNADLITIDLGTNNFGTFVTSTIQYILGLSDSKVEVDFTLYMDEQSAASLDAMLSQMIAEMIGEPGTQAYELGLTLARCLMFGYLGYTHNYDASLDEIYRLNPDVQVVVVDVYSMITGVELAGGALGENVDLDQLYNMFIELANFYSRELSPYASKVTHASLEGAPSLFIDYYKDYPDASYPDTQYLHPTAERLMDEFIMEMLGYDPDRPAEREAFQEEIMDGIVMLDGYVNDIQATVDQNVISGVVDPMIQENIDPVVAQVHDAIDGVLTAIDSVDQAIAGVAEARSAVDMAIDAVATAEEAVDTAVESVAFAQTVVDMVVENLIEGEYSSMFQGSATQSFMKSMIVSQIEEYITDDIMQQAGFEVTDENRTALAEEVYVMACIYYDEINVNGGTKEEANRLAVIEGMRYVLVEARGYTEEEAQQTAVLAYELDAINTASGRDAAVVAALETEVDTETAQLAVQLDKVYDAEGYDAAVKAAMATQVGEETAELAFQLNAIYEAQLAGGATQEEAKAVAVEAAVASQVGEETAALAMQLYGVYAQALEAGATEEAAMDAAIVAAIKTEYPAEGLAEAIYAVYKDKSTATYEQQEMAYITLMTGVQIKEGLVVTEEIATALFHCYADDLNGQYGDPYVQTAMCFFMVYMDAAASMEDAQDTYSQYVTYKNLPTTLSKIAKCPTIYFDALLSAASGSDDILGSVAEKFMAGTLALDEPVRENYESEEAYLAAVETYQSDSALATLYFRFMTQDGVFTHPSEEGQELLSSAVEQALGCLVVAAEEDEIQSAEQVLILGDNIAAAEGSYVQLLAEKLEGEVTDLSSDGFRINEVRALLDATYAGDAYTEALFGADRDALSVAYTDAVAKSDVVVVDLGAMNMGFLAPQLDKYMGSSGAETYAMEFGTVESMQIRQLGASIDALLAGFEQSFKNAENMDVGTLMLAFETYGYGFTTFTDCLDDTVETIKALNPDADIVLVGNFDLMGGVYFEANGIHLEMGDLIDHALALMDRYMEIYAGVEADVSYVDVSETENNVTEPFNMAETGISEAFSMILPTADGYAYMAQTIACQLGGHSYGNGTVVSQPDCDDTGITSYVCTACGETYDETVPALGHSIVGGSCERCGFVALSAPVITSCYSRQQTSVRVNWTPVEGAEGYKIYRTSTPEDNTSWSCIKTVTDGTIGKYTNQGLTEGVTYYYKVRAYITDAEGKMIYSPASEMSYMPAAVVFDQPYSNSNYRVRLRWHQVSGAHGYQIWRQNDDGTWSIIRTLGDRGNVLTNDQGSTTAYSNVGLEAGKIYTYKMRAFMITGDGGKVFGAYSDEYQVAVQPDTPTIQVSSPRADRAFIDWNAVDGATGYQIWMSTEQDGSYRIVKTINDGDISEYTKRELESGETYYFKVRAFIKIDDRTTFGEYSDIVPVTIQ